MNRIRFWNGNKSSNRQSHELEVLEEALFFSGIETSQTHIISDNTDYPNADDEGSIFDNGFDVLVTVAGNQKFESKAFIPIELPIAKGILGYRILITRPEITDRLATHVDKLPCVMKQLIAGIPDTWADADLFRFNNLKVLEHGDLLDILQAITTKQCDYLSLGANEVESIHHSRPKSVTNLVIESNTVLYYPFPLVFYVHPEQPDLAGRIETGLKNLMRNGRLDELLNKHYGEFVESLDIRSRKVIHLQNPILPQSMAFCKEPTLLRLVN